ncbi:MAG: hypothetical protein WCP28_16780 [Actinomycetes bacterium]
MAIFDDKARQLDRFGVLLILISVTIALASVVNFARPFSDRGEEIGNLLATYSTSVMLLLAASASGVSRRWRALPSSSVAATRSSSTKDRPSSR